MHFYLSSYLLGDGLDYLKEQALKYPKIALIPNAMDIEGLDPERLKKSNQETVNSLKELGFDVTILDLRNYFDHTQKLKSKLEEFDGVFVRGGNVFALR